MAILIFLLPDKLHCIVANCERISIELYGEVSSGLRLWTAIYSRRRFGIFDSFQLISTSINVVNAVIAA